ncbi:uncharacterized protein CTRU02_211559 [Colletotrichum truncatum]|uniref:Uncharacterized protein n=1 Tax=Colletotrichum truncatum TaxID=5467 RepID=A0ACC3YL18_COLTU|nr:uncharacterized protein CTRU02_14064 [Colletotrichum truncatum]KAF6782583.1 hypothetical protein CTRU02_14064 [Colletotrichum truncatum]
MCHGHPRWHPCSHTSINWHYCPAALIDLETGVETPCTHLSYAAAQSSNSDCPLLNCQFKAMGGNWTCCQCGQGPNTQGWCTMPKQPQDINGMFTEEVKTCDHGCCSECERYCMTCVETSDMTFGELRKGTASRKFGYSSAIRSHRRGSALSNISGLLAMDEEAEASSPLTSDSSPQSSVSYKSSATSTTSYNSTVSSTRDSLYKTGFEHNPKRLKLSSEKLRKHKSALRAQ